MTHYELYPKIGEDSREVVNGLGCHYVVPGIDHTKGTYLIISGEIDPEMMKGFAGRIAEI